MLEQALKYREAIDRITQQRDLGLRELELTDHEWSILMQLRDILKVSGLDTGAACWEKLTKVTGPQGRHTVFLTLHPKPCYRNPSNGPY